MQGYQSPEIPELLLWAYNSLVKGTWYSAMHNKPDLSKTSKFNLPASGVTSRRGKPQSEELIWKGENQEGGQTVDGRQMDKDKKMSKRTIKSNTAETQYKYGESQTNSPNRLGASRPSLCTILKGRPPFNSENDRLPYPDNSRSNQWISQRIH
jgi:hypothetical protein